ncbi:MAG: hypothetical protein ACFB9M_09755 [Myxococcota bacterium]
MRLHNVMAWRADSLWAHLTIQIVSVMIGALLALYLSELARSRAEQARVDVALRQMVGELTDNRDNLRAPSKQVDELAQRLGRAVAFLSRPRNEVTPDERRAFFDSLKGEWSIKRETIPSSAWDAAVSTGALTAVPPEILADVSEAYSRQEEMAEWTVFFLQSFVEGVAGLVTLAEEGVSDDFRRQVARDLIEAQAAMTSLHAMMEAVLESYEEALESIPPRLHPVP